MSDFRNFEIIIQGDIVPITEKNGLYKITGNQLRAFASLESLINFYTIKYNDKGEVIK